MQLRRKSKIQLQIVQLRRKHSAPQAQPSQASVIAYVQEKQARVGSPPHSNLAIGQVAPPDPRNRYLC